MKSKKQKNGGNALTCPLKEGSGTSTFFTRNPGLFFNSFISKTNFIKV